MAYETPQQYEAREKLEALYRAGHDWPQEALELMESGREYLGGLSTFLDELRQLLGLSGLASTTDILDHIEARLVEKEGV